MSSKVSDKVEVKSAESESVTVKPSEDKSSGAKRAALDILKCVLGAFMVSLGVYFFKFPNSFSTGGVSGISVILGNYFGLSSASDIAAVINAAMLVLGFIFLGKGCGIKTIVGTVTL